MDTINGTLHAGHAVPSFAADRLIAARAGVVAHIDAALERIAEASELAEAEGLGKGFWDAVAGAINATSSHSLVRDNVETARKRLTAHMDAQGWAFLLNASGMRTFLDAQARIEWDEQIENARESRYKSRTERAHGLSAIQQLPALNIENVNATFASIYEGRTELLERGVLQVYSGLSWSYARNLPERFGKRLLVNGVFNHYTKKRDALDDLERALCAYAGVPEPDHREAISTKLESARNRSGEKIETEFLSVRVYRNGNAHVTFLRPDLVERLNAVLAKHHPNALPPAR